MLLTTPSALILQPTISPYNTQHQTTTMAGTRQSTRNAAQANSSPPSATAPNGTKRKADDASPSSNKKKQQKTLEEIMPDEAKREEVKAAIANEDGDEKMEDKVEDKIEQEDLEDVAGTSIRN